MDRGQLIPGVSSDRCPPAVVAGSRRAIRRARIRAAIVDLTQLLLLFAVDCLFVRFPGTHVPLLDRFDSLRVVAAANALMVTYLCMARLLPRWRARHIADTWCPSERDRFHRR